MGTVDAIQFNGRPAVGFGVGDAVVAPVAAATAMSSWGLALTTSVVSATATWMLEELMGKSRKRRR